MLPRVNAFPASQLRQLAHHEVPPPPPPPQYCDLCSEPLLDEHRHLLETIEQQVCCACQACGILFDHKAAGGGHYRSIPRLRKRFTDFQLNDVLWAGLEIPVDMAFFVRHDTEPDTTAHYPSPLGTVGAAVTPDAWSRLVAANPILSEMDEEVTALLVHRGNGEHWLLGIDDCYRLTARLRSAWTGMTGGAEVWHEVANFFDELRGNSPRGKEKKWAGSSSENHR